MSFLSPLILAQSAAPASAAQVPPTSPAPDRPLEPAALKEAAASLLDSLRPTFSDTPWQAWLTLLLAVFAGVAAGRLIQVSLRKLAERAEGRGWRVRAVALRSAAGPANLALVTFGVFIGIAPLRLTEEVRAFATGVGALLCMVALTWLLFNLVDLVDFALRRLVGNTANRLDDLLVPLVRSALRIVIVILSVLFIVQNVFGQNIATWLAGLGIAGLAVSLAAQDPIRNFFGSLIVLMDRPFVIGDRVIFLGVEGTIENVGFRSTRIRTAAGHLVTVPNMKFTDTIVENVSARRGVRRVLNLTIPAATLPEKVQQAITIVKDVLTEPSIARSSAQNSRDDAPLVILSEFQPGHVTIQASYTHGEDKSLGPEEGRRQYLDHVDRVNATILRRFSEAGIKLA